MHRVTALLNTAMHPDPRKLFGFRLLVLQASTTHPKVGTEANCAFTFSAYNNIGLISAKVGSETISK